MLSKKQLEALKKQSKRRSRRPVPAFVPPTELKASGGLERRMTRDHGDVLQNIEFALVTAYREADNVDDQIVEATLRAAIQQSQPEDPRVQRVLEYVEGSRQLRTDLSDEVWTSGLRVVYTSVRRHSACRVGDRDYLEFVSPYLP